MVHAAHVQARVEEEKDEKDDAQEKEHQDYLFNYHDCAFYFTRVEGTLNTVTLFSYTWLKLNACCHHLKLIV